jgi:hypothetical protein
VKMFLCFFFFTRRELCLGESGQVRFSGYLPNIDVKCSGELQ